MYSKTLANPFLSTCKISCMEIPMNLISLDDGWSQMDGWMDGAMNAMLVSHASQH